MRPRDACQAGKNLDAHSLENAKLSEKKGGWLSEIVRILFVDMRGRNKQGQNLSLLQSSKKAKDAAA